MAYGSNPTGVQLLLNLRNDSDYNLLCFTFVGSDKLRWWEAVSLSCLQRDLSRQFD
jgi:hypothetical protein